MADYIFLKLTCNIVLSRLMAVWAKDEAGTDFFVTETSSHVLCCLDVISLLQP